MCVERGVSEHRASREFKEEGFQKVPRGWISKGIVGHPEEVGFVLRTLGSHGSILRKGMNDVTVMHWLPLAG